MTAVQAITGSLALCGYEALSGIDQAILDVIPAALGISSAAGVLVRHSRHAAELPEWSDLLAGGQTEPLIAKRDAARFEAVLYKIPDRLFRASAIDDAYSAAPGAILNGLRCTRTAIRLSPKTALAIAMGMQELAADAAKYGARSHENRRASARWSVGASDPPMPVLQRPESAAPAVEPPRSREFGPCPIERKLASDMNGNARIDYRPDGICCAMTGRLRSISA